MTAFAIFAVIVEDKTRMTNPMKLTCAIALLFLTPLVFADKRDGDNQPRPDFAKDQYFVAFRDGLTAENLNLPASVGAKIEARFPSLKVLALRIPNPAAVKALESNPRVEYVEQVPMRYRMDLSNQQLTPALNNGLYGILTTKSNLVHSRGVTGLGVKIGVADTGLDYTHPDIAPNYKGGTDTVSGDNDPWWNNDPNETHGTHVAGTIVAAFNTLGVFGVAYNADLYHARVLGPAGGTVADVMEGVQWLVETAGCKVVNLSLGGGRPSLTEASFYRQMRDKGALVVAATGNNGNPNRISYPANYAVNFAVGAVDRNNVHADFSNGGRNIDISGPGVSVLSSVPDNTGFEAFVTAASVNYLAYGMTYAGTTNGITGKLVNCGLGNPGQCPVDVAGNIALIQRGTISFADKTFNAMQAGAAGVVIYNNVPGDFQGTLGTPTAPGNVPWIPAVSVSDTTGAALLLQVNVPGSVLVNKISDWDHYSGTSMATPHVSGVAGLVWSANAGLTVAQVEQLLTSTAMDLGTPGWDSVYGFGLVNADAAVAGAGK